MSPDTLTDTLQNRSDDIRRYMEIKTVQLEEVLNERADEEMDVSDEEDYMGNKKRVRYDTSEEKASLKEENDSLRCQLEAYKNEVDLVRSDLKTDLDQKDKQLKMLQQTLQGMQQLGVMSDVAVLFQPDILDSDPAIF
uniref:Ecto-NOX disulfide-thiol exchanger 1/2 domain-containing protein n=1 Tax=Timema tahoe TaxID=61484 RepID=A0A7R9ITC5_9NEOP|nr:unnamed protein product [Timema tahoe]